LFRRFVVALPPPRRLPCPAVAQDGKPVKIAVIEDSTGPLQAYAEQMITGFKLGLEYGTKAL